MTLVSGPFPQALGVRCVSSRLMIGDSGNVLTLHENRYKGITIPTVSIAHLIARTTRAGRDVDKADVAALEEIRRRRGESGRT